MAQDGRGLVNQEIELTQFEEECRVRAFLDSAGQSGHSQGLLHISEAAAESVE